MVLTSMFLTYLMFYCFLKSRKRRWFIIIAFVSGYILTFCPILLPWSVDTVPVTALIMCGGYYFKNLSCDSVSKKWKTVITTIILLVYVVAIKQNIGFFHYTTSRCTKYTASDREVWRYIMRRLPQGSPAAICVQKKGSWKVWSNIEYAWQRQSLQRVRTQGFRSVPWRNASVGTGARSRNGKRAK